MLKELREKRAAAVARIKELQALNADESRKWSDEDEANWKAANADHDAIVAKIERAERAAKVESDLNERNEPPPAAAHNAQQSRENHDGEENRAPTQEDRSLALRAWMLRQSGRRVSQAHRDAANRCRVNLNAQEYVIPLLDTRSYQIFRGQEQRLATYVNLTAATGGYTVPTGFVANLERAMLAFSPLRGVADVIRTASGNALHWPTANDTSNKGELLAEETTVGDALAPSFGEKIFNAFKMSSKPVLVSSEILEDSAFDLSQVISSMLGERLGRIEADYFTTGTGTGQPGGVVAEATTGKTTSGQAVITIDEIIDLVHSVDPAYRTNPSCCFMASDGVWQYIRKIADGDGHHYWQPAVTLGQPDMLLGYRCVTNQSMAASVAHSAKTMLFGDFSKFKIRDVGSIRLRRLVERYADTDQEAFIAFSRVDSGVIDAGTHPIKLMVQA